MDNNTPGGNPVDIIAELLQSAVEKGLLKPKESANDFSNSMNEARKASAVLADSNAKAGSSSRHFANNLAGNTKGISKFSDRIAAGDAALAKLQQQIEVAEEALKKSEKSADDATYKREKRELEALKIKAAEQGVEHENLKKQGGAIKEAVNSFKRAIGSVYDGALLTVKSLQTTTDGIDTSIVALKAGIDVAAAGATFVGDMAAVFAKGAPAAVLEMFDGTAEAIAGVLKDVVDVLGTEITNTVASYRKISTAGATFAGGMEEMRDTASSAKMGLTEFTKIVTDNAKEFSAAGLGMTQAAKRFASVSRTMSESGLREQIGNLGYSFEEFGSLTADVMARLGTSGQLNLRSDQEIGQLTVEYAKNLRLISNITGEDAKKKMDEARKASLKAGIYEKVMQKSGAEGVAQFQKMMGLVATAAPQLQQGIMEYVATGGTAVRDVATNIAMQQIPEIKDFFNTFLNMVENPAMQSADTTKVLLENLGNIGQKLRESTGAIGAMGTSTILGATGPVAEFATLINGLRESTSKLPTDVEEFRRQVDKMAVDPGKLTTGMSRVTEIVQETKSQTEELLTKTLPGFSTALAGVAGAMDATTKKILSLFEPDKFTGPPLEKVKPRPTDPLGAQAWDSKHAKGWNPDGTPKVGPGAVVQESNEPGIIEKLLGPATPKKALGGITDGISIAGERGPEAVVPLPDGKTIPVEIRSTQAVYGDMVNPSSRSAKDSPHDMETFLQNQLKAMQNSASILENILTVLRDSYDTQDRMLANSY